MGTGDGFFGSAAAGTSSHPLGCRGWFGGLQRRLGHCYPRRGFQRAFEDPLGVVFALASTLVWALYWLLNAKDARQPLVGQWQNFSVGLPVLTLLLLFGPGLQWHGWSALGAGAYVGLFEMGVAFVLWQMAVQSVSRTAKVSNLIFLSPPVSLLLLFLVVGEPMRLSTLVGLILILCGLAIQQIPQARREPAL